MHVNIPMHNYDLPMNIMNAIDIFDFTVAL